MRRIPLKKKTELRGVIKKNNVNDKIVIFEDGGWTRVSSSTQRRGYYTITVREIILRAGNRDKIILTGDYRSRENYGKKLTKVLQDVEVEVFHFYMSYYEKKGGDRND